MFVLHQQATLCEWDSHQAPDMQNTPWTSNVYKIKGDKGFLAFFRDKSS